ncbi:chorismate mutase [Methanobrevibacter cuticularis]|uniref:Chorismate mutase n=1 Tax=Methanobrevibacter cuticularis TaxID=47311 RepID=A0A166F796_9EURY|nr:chorismate mutase [Methanobrevibacter cuticularis]KZX17389.1 chorismate mutase [Methanobrevibacter cuticularis]
MELISFTNEKEAKKLLKKSRTRIDEIDNELIDLIHERTSLAGDIVSSKIFLGMDIFDEKREKIIHDKILKIAKEKNIDENILSRIMNTLRDLSKVEQNKYKEEILRRK